MRSDFIAILCFAGALCSAHAQDCPKENPNGPSILSTPRTLTGKIVYHDDLRQWLGLQVSTPVCGVSEIQLVPADFDHPNPPAMEAFRNCNVSVHGTLDIPGTGYYSAEIYQRVDRIDPAPGCVLQPPFPDYSKAKPAASVRSYRVSMRIDYRPQGGPIAVTVRSGNRQLKPWQAYANYTLTGLFVFYGSCADGFDLTHFTGTPEAKPWLIDNQIAMDPETAASKHVTNIRLDYTCRRSR